MPGLSVLSRNTIERRANVRTRTQTDAYALTNIFMQALVKLELAFTVNVGERFQL